MGVRNAALYGLKRGMAYGGITAVALLLIRPAFWAGHYLATSLHGDVWLGM